MRKKNKKIRMILGIAFVFFVVFCLSIIIEIRFALSFDKEMFLSKGYSDEEIYFFTDVGFFHERIRKWEKDIKVEIVNIENLTVKDIVEVDSIIKILEPLVYPIKIERVEENGNLKVYRKVLKPIKYKNREVNGKASLSLPIFLNYDIKCAKIYDAYHINGEKTIFHEFLHALGLEHPSRLYIDFHTLLVTHKSPNIFYTIDELEEFNDMKFYISEQEKQVIRMLYSSGVKSGLRRSTFIKKMGLEY